MTIVLQVLYVCTCWDKFGLTLHAWPFNNTLFKYTINKNHYFVFRIAKGVASVLHTVDPNNSGFPSARGFSPGLFVRFVPTVFPLSPSHAHAKKHKHTHTFYTNIYMKIYTHINFLLVYPRHFHIDSLILFPLPTPSFPVISFFHLYFFLYLLPSFWNIFIIISRYYLGCTLVKLGKKTTNTYE